MSSPHDDFAKYIFSKLRRAAQALAAAVGPGIAHLIDWSTLKAETTELVDQARGRGFPDLRFTVKLRRVRVLIQVVWEHQSTIDRRMPIRFFRHTGALWGPDGQEERATVPLVLNVLLHNGPKPWSGSLELWSVIHGGELFVQHVPGLLPTLPIVIDDLAATPVEEIRSRPQRAAVRLTLLLLKLARAGESTRLLEDEGALVRDTPPEVLREGVRYALSVDPRATPEGLRQALEPLLGSNAKELVMTGMQLIEQGRTEGLKEGRTEGLAEGRAISVLDLLKANGIEVADADRERILASKDLDQLRVWLVRAATASSVADLFPTH